MSLSLSNTTSKNGIIQLIERNLKLNDGDISGSTMRMAQFVGDINIALDKAWSLILQASGIWTLDDSNQTDYPIIQTNLVSGQRDYAFTTDASGNIVLQIFRVMIASSSGLFSEIYPVSQNSTTQKTGSLESTDSFINGQNATGTPTRYSKTANGIFLDVIPNYNSTGGLKVFISRESTYFTISDTTKKPGFAGIFHEYLALRPSYQYAYRNGLSVTKQFQTEMLTMERAMQDYYSLRDKDVPKRANANVENTH